MKSLNLYIQEKLIVNKNYHDTTIVPKSFDELRKIIEDRYNKLGPGTKQKPIDFNDIDVSKMTTFYDNLSNKGIFDGTEFKYIDMSDWNVSNIKDMYRMFNECSNLKSVCDISNWNVSKVEDMSFMFNECYNLKSVGDISNWNVSNVKNMHYMFDSCEKLKSVGNLSKWDVSNVKDMRWMFDDSGITNIPDWYK